MSNERKRREALIYHSKPKPGKIKVIPSKNYRSQTDLSLAYSPGVAHPCIEINKNPDDVYKYTSKSNLVAVISNGTAVLGLGDIGPLASKPVMEGKGLLFKIFADIDVFDIEIDTKNIDEFIETVKNISPTFGGINLEDIKAPEAFEIERRLVDELDIPVMHDDQHGTAIISGAALINALELANKKIGEIQMVICGAGAAAISCAKMYKSLGVKKKNMLMFDSKGLININRKDLSLEKKLFASKNVEIESLADAINGSDVFIGLSKADIDISTSGDTITIKGNRERKAECKNDFYHYNEIGYGTFKRKFNIKNIVNIEGIKANFKNGVLQVNLPKKEDKSKRVKSIKVN